MAPSGMIICKYCMKEQWHSTFYNTFIFNPFTIGNILIAEKYYTSYDT